MDHSDPALRARCVALVGCSCCTAIHQYTLPHGLPVLSTSMFIGGSALYIKAVYQSLVSGDG
jgi:hypothetical protein